jgi:hypothetical protein
VAAVTRPCIVGLSLLLLPTVAHAGGGFTPITDESGVAALRASKPADWWLSGLHLVDLDADGDLDLFMSAHGGGALVGQNDGSGNFTAADGDYPQTEVHLPHDFDEDGLVDLSMTYLDGGGQWWRNVSNGGALAFEETDMTREGNSARQQVIVDIDADGDVDWLRGHHDLSIDLGDGMGFFEADAETFPVASGGDLGVLPADLDGDGDPDFVLTTGYYSADPERSRVFRNDGDFVLTDVTAASGVPMQDMIVKAVVDVDQDGDTDLVGLADTTFPHRVLLNDGSGVFTELAGAVTGDSGSAQYGSWGLGSGMDLDHDGIVDLVIDGRNYLKVLRGTGGGHFEYANDAWGIADVAEASVDGGFAFGDVDGDGDLDLVAWTEIYPERYIALYRNDVASGGFVRVRAIGLPGRKAAPTAKISIYAAGTDELLHHAELSIYCKQAQYVYYAFDETERHFGIADHDAVDVSVHFYPSFELITVEDVPANSLVRIGEDGRGEIVPPGGSDSGGSESGDASSGDDEGTSTSDGSSDTSTGSGTIGSTGSTSTDVDSSDTDDARVDGGEGCSCRQGGAPPPWLLVILVVSLARARTRAWCGPPLRPARRRPCA